ncbi:Type IV fimbrial biogenesis protein PilY1 [Labilithrix luteola]|uniref:Type IV fimbrial biogenesis protein PilY1 n=1 Tax=Labilithrix luteola TaxID=1391654 RepID=A0A0K1PMW5_9BACT|nr:hypothetical protein [Labilithrix luteola]AKU94857.1 Type IV fimbrial biogenesis protein PilY1 [Labilithrix luteola]
MKLSLSTTKLPVLAILACTAGSFVAVSCAASDEASPIPQDTTTIPDASAPDSSNEVDSGADAADAGCTDDAGCTTEVLGCDQADFCAVPTNIDARYALTSVWGSSANDVWAVGSAGAIVRWDGTQWSKIDSGRKETLRAVWGSSAHDIWIVAADNVILHGNGFQSGTATFGLTGPLDPTDPTNRMGGVLNAVWGSGPDAVFVGGDRTIFIGPDSMWRYRGPDSGTDSDWSAASTFCREPPCLAVNAIWGTSANDVWVAGPSGGMRHSKGPVGSGGAEEWSIVKSTLTQADLRALWGTSSDDVWVVGDQGTIRHWTNDSKQRWQIVSSPTTRDLRAVWGSSAKDIWAVGDAGTLLHWNGAEWTQATATFPLGPKPDLLGVWGSGPNDVWVVGTGVALHFTGAKTK